MINLLSYPVFSGNLATLKETSVDKRDNGSAVYMTESTKTVINFDKVKESYVEHLGLSEVPKSNDALFDDGKGNIIFVEFKNGYMDRPKQHAVRKKIYDSTLIFTDIVSVGISAMRTFAEYILVYNETVNAANPDEGIEQKKHVQASESFDSLAKAISGFAKEEYVCFGIDIFENYCFKKVHTYTEREFEQYVASL